MTAYRPHVYSQDGNGTPRPPPESADQVPILGAVREDIRQTLRTGWIDPALDAVAAYPVFFTAAWSAMRPNVGKTFVSLARSVRGGAADSVRSWLGLPDLRKQMDGELSREELGRIEDCVRASHLAAAKAQIVVHAFHRAVRRERIPGTGREEPPIRRGVPEWQRWMSLQPTPEAVHPVLEEAGKAFSLPFAPVPLRLFARWPAALRASWTELQRLVPTDAWRSARAKLRRTVLAGVGTLPHPVELQWAALSAKGFGEDDRRLLTDVLGAHDAAMPAQTLAAAFLWIAFGAPDISEG
jgi:hypothetical protein